MYVVALLRPLKDGGWKPLCCFSRRFQAAEVAIEESKEIGGWKIPSLIDAYYEVQSVNPEWL
jgi:hypothetical protein